MDMHCIFLQFFMIGNYFKSLSGKLQFSSVQFSHSIMSYSLWPMNYSTPSFPVHHQLSELVQTHVHWVGEAIQPSHPLSLIRFSSCPLSFPASGSFPMSRLFASGGQNIGASASASVLPLNIQDWFPLGLTGLISLLSKGLFQESSSPSLYYQQKK